MTDDRKYIYVKGEKIYVSDEIYKAYKKQVNHEAYLNKSDKKHKVYGYEDYKIDLNYIGDEDMDIEKIIETKMRIKDLYQALRNGYSCTMKSHFRKFGNQMSGSGNHLCEFTRVMLYLDHIPHAWTFHAQHQCL